MGVYIPPPSDGSNSGSGTGSSGSSGSGSSGGGGGTIITIPNPSSFFPQNPSLGLKLFGPLVPAADNTGALYFLTALQITIGCVGFSRARQLRKSRLLSLGIPNTFQRKLTKYSCVLGGSYLIFQSGLEITRFIVPYDPWLEEAKYYRKVATKNGDVPSWWFGATGYYKPMSFKEWNEKVERWIVNSINMEENALKRSQQAAVIGATPVSAPGVSSTAKLIANLAQKGRYREIYEQLKDTNVKSRDTLLAGELANVNELNKAERIDLILEGKGDVHYSEGYTKPPIILGNHSLESDEEFEVAWVNFEPWEELKLETGYDIRLIPLWRNTRQEVAEQTEWEEDVTVESSA